MCVPLAARSPRGSSERWSPQRRGRPQLVPSRPMNRATRPKLVPPGAGSRKPEPERGRHRDCAGDPRHLRSMSRASPQVRSGRDSTGFLGGSHTAGGAARRRWGWRQPSAVAPRFRGGKDKHHGGTSEPPDPAGEMARTTPNGEAGVRHGGLPPPPPLGRSTDPRARASWPRCRRACPGPSLPGGRRCEAEQGEPSRHPVEGRQAPSLRGSKARARASLLGARGRNRARAAVHPRGGSPRSTGCRFPGLPGSGPLPPPWHW